MEGWIKLHRKMLDNPIVMKDADHLAVWVYLLLHATHKEYPALFRGKKIVLQPGELITGRKSIAKELCIAESKAKNVLYDLEEEGQIGRQTSNKNSLITIVNWDLYQNDGQQYVQDIGLLPFVTKNNSDFVSKLDSKMDGKTNLKTIDSKRETTNPYQSDGQQNGQQLDGNWTTTGQQLDTNKNERIEEHKNYNYISSEKKNPDLYDRSLWENRALEAIRRNDEAALHRCMRTASAFGIHIDIEELKGR